MIVFQATKIIFLFSFYLVVCFCPSNGGKPTSVGRTGLDQVVQKTQQWDVQQSMDGDQLLAISARP